MTDAPQITVRKTIVWPSPDGFMTMDEEGQIGQDSTAEAVVRRIKRRDQAAARRGESTATIIDWRDMPEGFTPPADPQ